MFTLNPKPRFQRNLRRPLKKDPSLIEKVRMVLKKLQDNPRDPSLGSHKVTARNGVAAFSIEVTGDLRITWRYSKTEANVLELVDVGGHEGSRKVYR